MPWERCELFEYIKAIYNRSRLHSSLGYQSPVVAPEQFLSLKERLLSGTETNHYARWAKWFCSDPATRTLSPLSTITVPEYMQRRIEENTRESLREAVSVSPTNGLAYARLARQVLAQSDNDNPRRLGEADFFSRYAVKRSPQNAEVRAIRAEILKQIGMLPKQP